MVLTVLDQLAILDFQLGPYLNHEQLLDYCILDLETVSANCFTDTDVIAVEDKSSGLCFSWLFTTLQTRPCNENRVFPV